MRKLGSIALLLALLLGGRANAQISPTFTSGAITSGCAASVISPANCSASSYIILNTGSYTAVRFAIFNTTAFSATLQLYVSPVGDCNAFQPIAFNAQSSTSALVTSTTAAGLFDANGMNSCQIMLVATSYTSGTVTAALTAGPASVSTSSGGGTSSVTQGTSPWTISGAVTQGTSPWTISGSVTQGTSPWTISGSVTQGTSPWTVAGVQNSTGSNQYDPRCDHSAPINLSAAGMAELVSLSTGKVIYVCSIALSSNIASPGVTAQFFYGTSATCTGAAGPSTQQISGPIFLPAPGIGFSSPSMTPQMQTPSGDDFCINISGTMTANGVGGWISYGIW